MTRIRIGLVFAISDSMWLGETRLRNIEDNYIAAVLLDAKECCGGFKQGLNISQTLTFMQI